MVILSNVMDYRVTGNSILIIINIDDNNKQTK